MRPYFKRLAAAFALAVSLGLPAGAAPKDPENLPRLEHRSRPTCNPFRPYCAPNEPINSNFSPWLFGFALAASLGIVGCVSPVIERRAKGAIRSIRRRPQRQPPST